MFFFYHFCVYLQVSFAHFNLLKILAMDKSESPGKGSQVLVWSKLTIGRILGRHLHNSHGTKNSHQALMIRIHILHWVLGTYAFMQSSLADEHSHDQKVWFWPHMSIVHVGFLMVLMTSFKMEQCLSKNLLFWKKCFNSWFWNLTTIKLCISKYSLFTSFNIILTVWGNWMLMCPIHANFQLFLL